MFVEEVCGEFRLVVADESGVFLGDDAFSAIGPDEVAVHEVDDDLVNGPGFGDGACGEVVGGETGEGVAEGRRRHFVAIEDIGIHDHSRCTRAARIAVSPAANVTMNRPRQTRPHRFCDAALTVRPQVMAAVQNPLARWKQAARIPSG